MHTISPAAPSPTIRRRWCPGTRVLVGITAAWLVFVLAQRLFSGHWWFWLLVDVLPPALFLLVPLLLLLSVPILLACRVRLPVSARWSVVGVAVLAGVLGFDSSGVNLSSDSPVPSGSLHVFAWNTQYWDQTDNPDHFYAFLKSQHADVYLLQEYLNWDDKKDDKGAIRVVDTARLHREFPGYTLVTRGELLTLSRFPVVAQPLVGPDRLTVDWQTEFQNAKVLRTDILIKGKTVSFYNVHIPVQLDLSRGILNGSFYAYTQQANTQRHAQFAGLEANVAANHNPTLVAGDFNTSPAMADLAGLRDTMQVASTSFYPTSWQSSGWLRFWRLDWTFTRGIGVHKYGFQDAQGMSDHRPQDMMISI
jgi:endonuclease/exonuclease/phosphatase (EEP) superfamily protein YafD